MMVVISDDFPELVAVEWINQPCINAVHQYTSVAQKNLYNPKTKNENGSQEAGK